MRRMAETGASGIEYAMIVALIAAVVVISAATIGPQVSDNLTGGFGDGATTTSATVLGATLTKDCVGKAHAHQGCK